MTGAKRPHGVGQALAVLTVFGADRLAGLDADEAALLTGALAVLFAYLLRLAVPTDTDGDGIADTRDVLPFLAADDPQAP